MWRWCSVIRRPRLLSLLNWYFKRLFTAARPLGFQDRKWRIWTAILRWTASDYYDARSSELSLRNHISTAFWWQAIIWTRVTWLTVSRSWFSQFPTSRLLPWGQCVNDLSEQPFSFCVLLYFWVSPPTFDKPNLKKLKPHTSYGRGRMT